MWPIASPINVGKILSLVDKNTGGCDQYVIPKLRKYFITKGQKTFEDVTDSFYRNVGKVPLRGKTHLRMWAIGCPETSVRNYQ